VGRRWAWHKFTRKSVILAVNKLQEIKWNSKARLVLLCHCGVAKPEKPCHASVIQRYLLRPSPFWILPTPEEITRKCSNCDRDWKWWRGALDAAYDKFFCAICWCDYGEYTYKKELKYPLPNHPLLQPYDETRTLEQVASIRT